LAESEAVRADVEEWVELVLEGETFETIETYEHPLRG